MSLAKGTGSELQTALEILGLDLGADTVTFVRKTCSQNKTPGLDCLTQWSRARSKTPAVDLFAEAIPMSRLEDGQMVHLTPAQDKDGQAWTLLPVNTPGGLFGFLAVLSKTQDWSEDYTSALAAIFELWVAKWSEEKLLGDIVDYLPQPTFMMDTQEKIVFWNTACEEMTSWKSEDLVGKPRYDSGIPFYGCRRPMVGNLIMYPDTKWEDLYHEFERTQNGDVVYSLAFCNALYDVGAYLKTKTARLYDLNHRLRGSIHTVRDITLERKMEESAHRSESMHRAIADFAGMGIMLLRNKEIIYSNQQLQSFLGTGQDRLSLVKFCDWIAPEDRNKVLECLNTSHKQTQSRFRFEFRSQQGDELRHYRALTQEIEYDGNPAIHLILDDITEQKRNEMKLFHNDRLTSLGTMAAGIAHELNQPLNTIRVITDGFLFGRDEEWDLDTDELYESLNLVSRQVLRMTQVIQNIRDFAREEGNRSYVDVDVNHALENVFSMIGRQIEAHGIDVEKHFEQELPPVRANLYQLEQVLMNLLVNARQALDGSQSSSKTIAVRTGHCHDRLQIEVIDNATGIKTDRLDNVFDPFYTTKEPGVGTGLGLSICQSIITGLGGHIKVYNNDSGGATFVIQIPGGGL